MLKASATPDGIERLKGQVMQQSVLVDYAGQLTSVSDDVGAFMSDLSSTQVRWRPAADSWSIGDCLLHLCLVGELYGPIIEGGIRAARERGKIGDGQVRYRWLERLMIRASEPPVRRRFRAPRAFSPQASQYTVSGLSERFGAMQASLQATIVSARGIDLNRCRIPSPAARYVRLGLGAAFALLAAHERRHVWQARQVCASLGFPRS